MASGDRPSNVPGDPDLERVETLGQLGVALNRLRGGRSYSDLIRAAARQPWRDGRQPSLARATISDLVNGRSVPNRDTLITFLTACGLSSGDHAGWLAAWERAATAQMRRPAGAVRVRDSRARRLGVHASIQVDHRTDDLPVYVQRDFDDELHAAVGEAAAGGGMVLLNGGSSVGKTRAMFEAIRAVLPDWWVVQPGDPAAVEAFAEAPTARTVVWLDELQRYLRRPGRADGLAPGIVRRLLDDRTVVVATLWPDEYAARVAPGGGREDLYATDRETLKLARVIDVPDAFTAAELLRAEAAAGDARIRVALNTADAGVTQVLAAGPELVRWWRNAPAGQAYGRAVITAALDARRVGAEAPLTCEFLAAAAPAYLSSAQQATAGESWFADALGYATTWLHGATSCLVPVAAQMGAVAGYVVADYLFQDALRDRRTIHLADTVWQALVDHHDARDAGQLAVSAYRRGRLSEGIAFDVRATDAGVSWAPGRLADHLVRAGFVDDALHVLRQQARTDGLRRSDLDPMPLS